MSYFFKSDLSLVCSPTPLSGMLAYPNNHSDQFGRGFSHKNVRVCLMEFIIGLIKVLVGAFVLFTVARLTYENIGQRSKWGWVAFVGGLALANMLLYRLLGSSINPPFFTALLFGVTIAGLTPKDSPTMSVWYKRAIYAIVLGTLIGWASYAEVGHI
jgi:hypothetical protein